MKNFWDIKECPFNGTNASEVSCPVYANQTSCWEFDWLSFYDAMPDGSDKYEWKRMMIEGCSDCKVRNLHEREVDAFLTKFGGVYSQ